MALLQNAISEDYRDKETFNLGLVFKVKRLRVNLQSAKTEAQSRKLDHIDDKSNKDAWSAQPWQASKFAHWFLEEEKKPIDDISSSKNRLTVINCQ
ncbi:hypothetical protein MRB53_002398 [Persea americana]|uniref:Uncharacterized protein n=1 Tax=Persea americana TaxID=3435 RepID=A0ACC2MUE1_PERAE|nr:hypothetical protein MRB53_002398 [Persea americana]